MEEISGILQRSGSAIHYWVAGPKRAPMVAFTHGASMDHRMFAGQLPAVWKAGYRTLRWDIRGHGRSKPLGKVPLRMTDVAEDLQALLDNHLLGRQVCLVGQALGAQVSQQIVFSRPERVAALVVIGAGCVTFPAGPWHAWASAWSRAGCRLRSGRTLRQRLARASGIVPAVQTYAYDATQRLTRGELLAALRAGAGKIRSDPTYRIEQPLLLVHGEYDGTTGVRRLAPRWAARDPRCRYEVIRRAGHHAHQDNPAAFNRLLLEFLAEHFPLPRGLHP
ncbi:alpha/beta hydrolase [Actinopolymorpha sp. B11F2]|uniref:alpha/beta fold hydrolase n=1 Tax=Actinopolymorpha sp. B11F2 TaxID=3160862 RepID=UPI0032E4B720